MGVMFPQPLTGVERTSGPSVVFPAGTKITDHKLATSAMYGLKRGYYLDNLRWLGIEGEIFNTNPHVKQQTETLTPPSGPSLTGTTSGSYLTVLTLATNVVVRYPGESLQPYIGVGPGIFFARNHFSTGAAESSTATTQLGLNALAGLRYLATEHAAVSIEGKYSHAQLNFGQSNTIPVSNNTYNAFHAAFGNAYHF